MKKVIFLCLLSLSLCIAKPTNDQGATVPVPPSPPPSPAQPQPSVSPNAAPVVPNAPKVAETAPVPVPIIVPVPNPSPAPNTPQVKSEQAAAPAAPSKPVGPAPVNPVGPAPIPTIDNKTTEKKEEIPPQGKPQEAPANKTEEVPKTPAPAPAVTVKPSDPAKPAVAPKDDAAVHPIETRSGFDGPSFIGGIILTLGLLAIGFMGFKYYKNQTERNYHTL